MRRVRLLGASAALAVALSSSAPAQQPGQQPSEQPAQEPGPQPGQLIVATWAADPADEALLAWCQQVAGDELTVRVVRGDTDGAIDVYLGAPLVVLQRIAQAGALARRDDWGALPAAALGADGRFAAVWVEPTVLAWSRGAFDAAPMRVEDLLWELPFDQRVVLPVAKGAPELWAGWRDGLARRFGVEKAIAWLSRLDGRVGRYAGDPAEAVAQLREPRGYVTVAPRGLVLGRDTIEWAAPEEGAPSHLLGVASGLRREAVQFMERALMPRAMVDLAGILEVRPPSADQLMGGQPLAEGFATEVHAWWVASVRGKGASLERLDFWLDLIVGVLFAALLLGIFLHLRKSGLAAPNSKS